MHIHTARLKSWPPPDGHFPQITSIAVFLSGNIYHESLLKSSRGRPDLYRSFDSHQKAWGEKVIRGYQAGSKILLDNYFFAQRTAQNGKIERGTSWDEFEMK